MSIDDQLREYVVLCENFVSTPLVAELYIMIVKDHDATSDAEDKNGRKETNNI